jgi:hypothetical protein
MMRAGAGTRWMLRRTRPPTATPWCRSLPTAATYRTTTPLRANSLRPNGSTSPSPWRPRSLAGPCKRLRLLNCDACLARRSIGHAGVRAAESPCYHKGPCTGRLSFPALHTRRLPTRNRCYCVHHYPDAGKRQISRAPSRHSGMPHTARAGHLQQTEAVCPALLTGPSRSCTSCCWILQRPQPDARRLNPQWASLCGGFSPAQPLTLRSSARRFWPRARLCRLHVRACRFLRPSRQ